MLQPSPGACRLLSCSWPQHPHHPALPPLLVELSLPSVCPLGPSISPARPLHRRSSPSSSATVDQSTDFCRALSGVFTHLRPCNCDPGHGCLYVGKILQKGLFATAQGKLRTCSGARISRPRGTDRLGLAQEPLLRAPCPLPASATRGRLWPSESVPCRLCSQPSALCRSLAPVIAQVLNRSPQGPPASFPLLPPLRTRFQTHQARSLFLKHARHGPASGPLLRLCPLPGSFFLRMSVWLPSSPPSGPCPNPDRSSWPSSLKQPSPILLKALLLLYFSSYKSTSCCCSPSHPLEGELHGLVFTRLVMQGAVVTGAKPHGVGLIRGSGLRLGSQDYPRRPCRKVPCAVKLSRPFT